jgi:hypothetical protein
LLKEWEALERFRTSIFYFLKRHYSFLFLSLFTLAPFFPELHSTKEWEALERFPHITSLILKNIIFYLLLLILASPPSKISTNTTPAGCLFDSKHFTYNKFHHVRFASSIHNALRETGVCRAPRVHDKGRKTHGKKHMVEICTVKSHYRASSLTTHGELSLPCVAGRRMAKKSSSRRRLQTAWNGLCRAPI